MVNDFYVDWKPISTAPYVGELELAVIDKDVIRAVTFPCRRVVGGWIAAETNKWINVKPTHWRVWPSAVKRNRGTIRKPSVSASPSGPLLEAGRKVMEWFNGRTSIAGVQLPNWLVVLGAIVLILLIYTSIH